MLSSSGVGCIFCSKYNKFYRIVFGVILNAPKIYICSSAPGLTPGFSTGLMSSINIDAVRLTLVLGDLVVDRADYVGSHRCPKDIELNYQEKY